MSWLAMAARVRYPRAPKWGWAVYYGSPQWPSYSFWIVPGTVKR